MGLFGESAAEIKGRLEADARARSIAAEYRGIEQQARARTAEARAIAAEERSIEAEKRSVASERRAINKDNDERAARQRSEKLQQEYINNPTASDVLGAGRLGTLADAHAENMLNPNGLFIGRLEGRPLFYNGDSHLLNYGKNRSGKGRDIVLPNLAHVFNRSIVVNDIKDGENAYASAEYREKKGHRIITVNPYNLLGYPSFKLNPFQRIIDKANQGLPVSEDCLQICMSIVPPVEGKNKWVAAGAQQILATWLEWSAIYRPDRCTLSNMWRFVFRDFAETLKAIMNCGHDGIEGQADKIAGYYDSDSQWTAYESELVDGLWNFRPDSPLAIATESTDFNPENMRHEKTTLYLMGNSEVLEASAKWISLTISSIVNSCAHEAGQIPVTFIIDELANLPYMDIIPKALTLYAGKGVQLWGLCQGREALRNKGYTEHAIKNFENQSGIFHCWDVNETSLIKDIELRSGNMAVATKGINISQGTVASGGFNVSEQKRPVLQSEDIVAVGKGRQIIRATGAHLYVADRVPWYEVPSWQGQLKDVRKIHFEKPKSAQAELPVTRKLPPPPD